MFKRHFSLFPLWVSIVFCCVLLLGHYGVFPISPFLGGVAGLVFFGWAIVNPRAVFGTLLASVPLEYIPFFSLGGTDIRWYQLISLCLFLGIVVRMVGKKESVVELFRLFSVFDAGMLLLGCLSIVSALLNRGEAIKQTAVLFSFLLIYFLVRYGIRRKEDILYSAPFLAGPFFLTILYGIAQNILFFAGGRHNETMPGRPNASFSEPDWLGMYAAVGMTVVCAVAANFLDRKKRSGQSIVLLFIFFELIFFSSMVLFMTVARSAWLGAAAGLLGTGVGIVAVYGWKKAFRWGGWIAGLTGLALFFVFGLGLTRFDLIDRAKSVESGMQEITVACSKETINKLPSSIETVSDLEKYQCWHIRLEEISLYEKEGFFVRKVFRKDPNVEVRKNIWEKSMHAVAENPIFGIGWGNSRLILGVDERGNFFNASNLFLEVWLGSGIAGVVVFFVIFFGVLYNSFRMYFSAPMGEKNIFLACAGTGVVFIVFNVFNAGHFLAILWLWLGYAVSISYREFSRSPRNIS